MIQKHVEILKDTQTEIKTILEIGSRDGHDARYYQKEFQINDSDTYIVEPNPLMVKKIKETYPFYHVFDVALNIKEGLFYFNMVKDNDNMDLVGMSSLLDRVDDFYTEFKTEKILVNTIKGSTLLKKINKKIDICKIDVEGLSYEVLLSFEDEIKKIKTIHIETEKNVIWINQKTHNEVCELLEKLGFTMLLELDISPWQYDSIWLKK